MIVFGTRPEAIKMAPLVKAFKTREDTFDTKVCVTGQHRSMLDQVLSFFNITPDFDLDIMKPGQDLSDLTANVVLGMRTVFNEWKPDYVLVHGDTTTSVAVALAAYYARVKVAHVEAGLRTYDKHNPFPEEMNRQITGRLADLHLAPTESARENLLREGANADTVAVTGNTVIDALFESVELVNDPAFKQEEIDMLKTTIDLSKKILLVTGHRRENFGSGFISICEALKQLAEERPELEIVYPVHLNPNVQGPVFDLLSGMPNIKLIAPLSYPAFVWMMDKASLILTDSGGVQEEAPSLGKPVLVMREVTERPEAVDAGTVILVGTDKEKIVAEVSSLLDDTARYEQMSTAHNPYGDGLAAGRVVQLLENALVAELAY